MKRKLMSLGMMLTLGISALFSPVQLIRADDQVTTPAKVHTIEGGPSFEGNPLKGFIPYDELTTGSVTDFPHSMEWFYLPVSDVQLSMDTFDWKALEERLNQVAARGNQAVFRFYYDYPGLPTGVPQFLIDGGLILHPYDEPDNLGGAGLCPDYSNPLFLQSMQSFIKAFGEAYDGDPRIGAITLGLLGFWGEWHTWPYDEDTSDQKPNWNIPTQVYSEVLKAYDQAFDTTLLCMREPKWDVDQASAKVGFHDDSFAFATLTEAAGGQSWSFMSKMTGLNMQDRWQTQCIGGELYPPTQGTLFENEGWISESGQSFQACLDQTHVTWLINEAIKTYEGDERIAARKASVLMGYDLQVQSATYQDQVTDGRQQLEVAISNQGTAPFYYDHKTWPVEIGLFKSGELIQTVRTNWDLNKIGADKQTVVFSQEMNQTLENGEYSYGLRVVNPLKNGKALKFANKDQQDSGWLIIAKFTVVANTKATAEATKKELSLGILWGLLIVGVAACGLYFFGRNRKNNPSNKQ